ncbi:MAG: metal ABC transporter substrate-binding protein [bacterium]|nr:metal ABC transporter substrate-binding protein [bacterium]
MKKDFILLFLVGIILLMSISCSRPVQEKRKPIIVTTIFPIADLVKNIAGDDFEVIYLIKPGQDPHSFEPEPQTIINIRNSKVIFKVGFGFEFWLDKILSGDSAVIDLSNQIAPIDSYDEHDSHSDNHSQDMKDPHYWLSPKNIILLIPEIKSALQKTFPEHEEIFENNSALYLNKIIALDTKISEGLNNCQNKKYIAYHPAWLYFSRDYGLEMRGVILHNPGQEPLPGELAEIIETVKTENIKVIFSEKLIPQNIPQIIASETNAKVIILDPLGGMGELDSYIKLMEYNFDQIQEGMCGK